MIFHHDWVLVFPYLPPVLYDLHDRADLGEENVLKDDEVFMIFDNLDDFEGISPVGLFQFVACNEWDGFLEGEFDIEFARHGENGLAIFLKAIRFGSLACGHEPKSENSGEDYHESLHTH